jgi:hypothetical protein
MSPRRRRSLIQEACVTTAQRTLACLFPVALTAIVAACGGDEPQGVEDHTPTSYNILVNGVAVSAPYTFTVGQTVRVQIKFFNAAQEDLDAVEAGHFGGLTFNPASLVTAVRRQEHHYQFDVTGETPGTGTLHVSFGHDEQADEHVFDPVQVTVTGGGGPPL